MKNTAKLPIRQIVIYGQKPHCAKESLRPYFTAAIKAKSAKEQTIMRRIINSLGDR